jgi:sugar phosphate isomerase/epimerase
MLLRRSFLQSLAVSASAAAARARAGRWTERMGIMCQLGASEKTAREVLSAAREAGFHRAQINFAWDRVDAGFIRGVPGWVRDSGLRIEAVGAYVNWAAPEVVIMNTRVEDFARAMDLAGELESGRLVSWTGSHTAGLMTPDERNFTPAAEAALARNLEPHVKQLERRRLKLALETYVTLVCPDGPSLRRLLNRLPATVGAVFDPPNMTPVARFAEREQVLAEMVSALKGRVIVVHLKDFRLAADGKSYQLPGPLGGDTDYRKLAKVVNSLDAAIPVIIEHVGPKEFRDIRTRVLEVFDSAA